MNKMNGCIEERINNLREFLSWKEEECERSRLSLAERVSKCTAEQIAHGWLESDIGTIGREVEEIRSLRDQIRLLEIILENTQTEMKKEV